MQGSIVERQGKRGKSLFVVVTINQKQRWMKVPGKQTKQNAEAYRARLVTEINQGIYFEPTHITFDEYQEIWFQKYAQQLAANSRNNYQQIIRLYLLPFFSQRLLTHITAESVQEFVTELSQKVAPQTVAGALALLKSMLNRSVEWEYLLKNPAKFVKPPRVPRHESRVLAPEQVKRLLSHAPSHEWYTFFLLAVTTGMRVGELLVLRWGNVDWKDSRYYVRETLIYVPKEKGIGAPKSEASTNPVDLTPLCIVALREHKKNQEEKLSVRGEKIEDQTFIFTTSRGTPYDHSHMTNRVYFPTLKSAGLPKIRFHDLRHTCASLLINQGENPKYIQRQLRHSSIQITFDRYGHLFPDIHREAGKRLDDTLFPE